MKYNFLIDIGNSNIKTGFGKSGSGRIFSPKSFEYDKRNFIPELKIILRKSIRDFTGKEKIDKIGISTNSGNTGIISKVLYDVTNIKPVFIESTMKLPIRIKYKTRPGSDRICAAAGAVEKYNSKKEKLVIDFGTATTFNYIIDNIFIGGLITPGAGTALKSLIQNTTLQGVKISSKFKLVSDNTSGNISSGVLLSAMLTAEGIIRLAKKRYRNLFIITTGGHSRLLRNHLQSVDVYDNNLVLSGINSILNNAE